MPTSASDPILEVRNLVAGYQRLTVVRDVSLVVHPGELVSLLGANGMGKTTLLRAITGAARITSGTVAIGGRQVQGSKSHVITRLGVALVPEGRGLLPQSSVRDNLVVGTIPWSRRFAGAQVDAAVAAACEQFPALGQRLEQRAGSLSGGEQQMLAIGRALVARPRILILDEPSLGLAPRLVRQVFDALAVANTRGTTVLVAEQNAAAVQRIATRSYVMQGGRFVIEGDAADIQRSDQLRAAFLGPQGEPS